MVIAATSQGNIRFTFLVTNRPIQERVRNTLLALIYWRYLAVHFENVW
jgi:hypothetical protein